MDQRGTYLQVSQKVWLCPICDKPIHHWQGMDMHEALLTKEHVKSQQEWAWLINHPANCVLRHHNSNGCWHNPGVGGDEIFEKCARQLVMYEGRDNVISFLEAMMQFYPTNAQASLRRFKEIEFIDFPMEIP